VSDDDEKSANKDDRSSGGVSRRDFMAITAITAGAVAAPTVLANIGQRSMKTVSKDQYETDILVIGSGFAGTFAALEAAGNGLSVVMVDKGSVGWSGLSPWASDSRPFDPTIYDRDEWHRNLSTNTEWLYDRAWIDIFLDESLGIFHTLREWGVHECHPFERSKIFRQRLDANAVDIVERTMITSLLQDESGRVCGAVGFKFDDSKEACRAIVFKAKAVILCTGAGAYKSPGFPNWGQTFDGDAMAYAAGAPITGKEFHDTHQTFSNYPAASYDGWDWAQGVTGAFIMVGPPNPLSGGLTLDGALNAHQGKIYRKPGGGPGGEEPPPPGGPESPDRIANRKYLGRGFLTLPNLHLDLGGPPEGSAREDLGFRVGGSTAGMGVHKGEGVFNSDYTCQADGVEGLWAAGDALGSMMCGTTYPGRGFSSYGSAIQGRRAAVHASAYAKAAGAPKLNASYVSEQVAKIWKPMEREKGFDAGWLTQVLRNTMTPLHVLYIKDPRRLDGALASIEYLRKTVVPNLIAQDGHRLRVAHEAMNMLLNAEMKLRAGLYRQESRGTHYREDFPARDDKNWRCWVLIRQGQDGSMNLSKHPVPWGPDNSIDYRTRYPRILPGEDEFLKSNPHWL
jgi:succinate dehydrogenase/fumarate reductase flavoprotein subunit